MKEQYAAKNFPNALPHMTTLHILLCFSSVPLGSDLPYPSGPPHRTRGVRFLCKGGKRCNHILSQKPHRG